uniref:Uncharacterized protein n=1 Tax=Leersia perrieri TaxID=77586 RepID=A0A0D9VWH1_9ORYZ
MPAHMPPHRRSSFYPSVSVSTRKINPDRGLVATKKRSSSIAPPSDSSEEITAGTTVSVRTRVGKLRGGKTLVLWLSAVVVSATDEEGYLTVLYNGNFPPEDLFKTVRVARQETKRMAVPAAGDNAAEAPRPTTAGKSVAVLKRVYPEAF